MAVDHLFLPRDRHPGESGAEFYEGDSGCFCSFREKAAFGEARNIVRLKDKYLIVFLPDDHVDPHKIPATQGLEELKGVFLAFFLDIGRY